MELKGKFIVFEGIDFSGKSTQAKLLAARLKYIGLDVVLTREPGGTKIGEAIRKLILSAENNKILPVSELLLFITSRAQLCFEVIKPALLAGKTVISSRYTLSSLAYQGYGRGIDLTLIHQLNEIATEGLKPDITFFIDIPVDVALARRKIKGDRIEREEESFYKAVRQGYLQAIAESNQTNISEEQQTLSSDTPLAQTDLAFAPSEAQMDFLQKVRQGYLELVSENPKVYKLDGRKSISEIASEVAFYLKV